jgi:hypothetical protein
MCCTRAGPRGGDAVFGVRGRGGSHYQQITPQQEAQLLAPLVRRAEVGGMLTVAEIQQAYRQRAGTAVAPSAMYRLCCGGTAQSQAGAAAAAPEGRRSGADRR